ncbi:hypothetical protein NL676_030490 [Syzygium grande]|nr:hypothetical protein NL676_030490 [Syzygium grande]
MISDHRLSRGKLGFLGFWGFLRRSTRGRLWISRYTGEELRSYRKIAIISSLHRSSRLVRVSSLRSHASLRTSARRRDVGVAAEQQRRVFYSLFWSRCYLLTRFLCVTNSEFKSLLDVTPKMDPSDVRYLKGSFGEAFHSHQKHFDENDIQKGQQALREVSYLRGWESEKVANGHEGELVEKVKKKVLSELQQDFQLDVRMRPGWSVNFTNISAR